MNMIDIKTNEAAIFSLYLNTHLMYGDKRYIEIIFLTVYCKICHFPYPYEETDLTSGFADSENPQSEAFDRLTVIILQLLD